MYARLFCFQLFGLIFAYIKILQNKCFLKGLCNLIWSKIFCLCNFGWICQRYTSQLSWKGEMVTFYALGVDFPVKAGITFVLIICSLKRYSSWYEIGTATYSSIRVQKQHRQLQAGLVRYRVFSKNSALFSTFQTCWLKWLETKLRNCCWKA